MSNETDRLLTAKQAAKRYSIHERTFRDWSREKADWPKPVLLNSAHRWKLSDVLTHIAKMDTIRA